MARIRIQAAVLFVALVVIAFCQPLPAAESSESKAAPPQDAPVPLQDAPAKMTLPEGFRATLFAGEPDVVQPIAMAFDARGRLWVAECLSYPEWKAEGKDRVVIFEDANGDGRFDTRKVFWEEGNFLTGLQVGFGGVWVCCAPHLLFIPDANGDDVPDGKPVLHLDGWSTKGKHNVVNALNWGPDGWLYGCNGITSPSKVGRPETPEQERIAINCGVWRYHPVRHEFEVVANGGTNPFGLDFDDYGQTFVTNCVISHLFHVIPGGHYKRMSGQDENKYAYELMDACCDHLHWGGGEWTTSRGGQGAHSIAGGGHAHSGAVIYLADQWPAEYRGSILMCNIHGNRLNRDLLERHGSGYVGRHGKDFLMANDSWFRGVALLQGPDGNIFVTDWSDTGECHDYDQVDRTHGRIYKISYGDTKTARPDLASLSDKELVELQTSRSDWHVRQARRLLQERATAGQNMQAVHDSLREKWTGTMESAQKLRLLWALHVTGGLDEAALLEHSADPDEHLRHWAVRLLCENKKPSAAAIKRLTEMAGGEDSAHVRLSLAAALQRIPLEERWAIAESLLARAQDAEDHSLPLMTWYGIEPAVAADKQRALALLTKCKIPQVRQLIARRLAAK